MTPDNDASGEPDGMSDDDLGNALATRPAPRHKPLNIDHPHGDGTYNTPAGDPLDRLGAGGKYGE